MLKAGRKGRGVLEFSEMGGLPEMGGGLFLKWGGGGVLTPLRTMLNSTHFSSWYIMLNDSRYKFVPLLHFKLIFDLLFNADLGMI